MKTLVLGVWYNELNDYGKDYFISLLNQFDNDFDTLIITDGAELPEEYMNSRLITFAAKEDYSPADIRNQGIQFALDNNYEILIFSDCDDYFSADRIAKSKAGLSESGIFMNNLTLVSSKNQIIKEKIYTRSQNDLTFLDLVKGNSLGLSNTAISLNSLPGDFYIPSDVIAVDWWIFSLLLLNKVKITFDVDVVTYYRQHASNTIGMNGCLNKQKLILGIRTKKIHYENLQKYIQNNGGGEFLEIINEQISGLDELINSLQNAGFEQKYINTINKHYSQVNLGWWSEVLTLNDWKQYA